MITSYVQSNNCLQPGDASQLGQSPLWVDLLNPTLEEQRLVEKALGISLPTREEMQEIEATSRLYREEQAVFVTVPLLVAADSSVPTTAAVTFILIPGCTVTIRYATPRSFETFIARIQRPNSHQPTADGVLMGLMESIVDRLADVLEAIGTRLDQTSQAIFRGSSLGKKERPNHTKLLSTVGASGDLTSKVQESLLGLNRAVTFLGQSADDMLGKRTRMKMVTRDIRSLTEHAVFLSGKVGFLLDATLGMINIEQNNIIKIFSVVAFVFLPPTLIASIYGMNFQSLPELHWDYGYYYALALMIISAITPYFFFKKRGWL